MLLDFSEPCRVYFIFIILRTLIACVFLQDAHEFLNYLLNELVDILEKESHVAKTLPDESLPSGQTANGPRNAPTNGVQKEPLVTWVHKNFQVNIP